MVEVLPKSKAFPGVLGVLVVDPKDANAPEPSPNAEEAPGDAVMLVFNGEAPLGNAARVGVSEPVRFSVGKWRESFLLSRSSVCEGFGLLVLLHSVNIKMERAFTMVHT